MFRSTALWFGGLCLLLLTACGGSSSQQIVMPTPNPGSSGGGGIGSSGGAPTVTISGKATYERVPVTATGLNYSAIATLPIRGAVVEVRNSAGTTVLYSSTTEEDGTYAVKAPFNTTVMVLITAQLGTTTANRTKVVDNTNGGALYAMYVDQTVVGSNLTGVDMNAPSGWDAGSATYKGARISAVFAILDTIYDARKLILSADSTVIFPALSVNWSPNNSTSVTSIQTTYFSPSAKAIYVLGKEGNDTDEFDQHVIAHEWGHYFEHFFSRSDSVGGPHGEKDILDERVAFSEGWGNAFSGMVTRDSVYLDTMGVNQRSVLKMELENDSVSDVEPVGGSRLYDGAWSESSVQEILWDCFDGSTSGVADKDGDTVNLGFKPLYAVFVNAQKTTPGFTTMYSFMFHLKAANSAVTAALSGLESRENILAHDGFEESSRPRYTTIALTDGTPQTLDFNNQQLTTKDTYGDIFSTYSGNKLFNWQFLKVTVPSSADLFLLKVKPLDTSATGGNVLLQLGGPQAATVNEFSAGKSENVSVSTTKFPSGTVISIAVGSFVTTGITTGVTPFTVSFGTTSQVTPAPNKPQVTPPKAPAGNG